jgi:8-oxo-dGTP diphosphatase
MRDWLVGGGVIEAPEGLLLVRNRRRSGRVDWSPPGGVIDEGETLLGGLTREVEEETGLRVIEWAGPVYTISCEAPDLGWRLRVETHVAVAYEGEVRVDDPDGIVDEVRFFAPADLHDQLTDQYQWVREPLLEWFAERWDTSREYAYRVEGADALSVAVTRL